MLKKVALNLLGCSLVFFAACSKKSEAPPQGKFVIFAKSVNILPKMVSNGQYRIEVDEIKKEGMKVDLQKTTNFDVASFMQKAKESQFFEKPNQPKAFIIATSLDKRGEMKEYGAAFELKKLDYNPQTMTLTFDASSIEEISPWILAKPSKLLSFEFFFQTP
jgi:hypothetical protein